VHRTVFTRPTKRSRRSVKDYCNRGEAVDESVVSALDSTPFEHRAGGPHVVFLNLRGEKRLLVSPCCRNPSEDMDV